MTFPYSAMEFKGIEEDVSKQKNTALLIWEGGIFVIC